CQHYNSAPWTF
nr:immunoglobulin light chain junction region [Macaca mulatta]MOW62019.1 immunoglobulin light chain junction region [Macaca mulatta]MOW62789.1 immunoglobulin light chain junction region [Macaca mulatta]MOW63125.1 immunoglobulin light chain junction region [Macaca mulatta]MOW63158.1 immunoglobulin light chain junction region [Macaca mulatta]